MKGFFSGMSFPRAVILFCSLGSLALGALVYLRSQRLSEVKEELRRVPNLIKEIQTDAYRLAELQKTADANKFKEQSEPESYIRSVASDDTVSVGQVAIQKTPKTPARGIEDNCYKITPQQKSSRFTRAQVGNFLFKLEHDSPRVKVTRLKLVPSDKVSPGEVGKDQWVFEAELTTRTKTDTAPAPSAEG